MFIAQCVVASTEIFVEAWIHDEAGQLLHVPPVRRLSKFDAVVDRLEAGDEAPHLNG